MRRGGVEIAPLPFFAIWPLVLFRRFLPVSFRAGLLRLFDLTQKLLQFLTTKQALAVHRVDSNRYPAFVGPLPQHVLADPQKLGSLNNFEVVVQLFHHQLR